LYGEKIRMDTLTPTVILELPLRLDDAGRWRVGGTRIPIETVIIAFQQGSSPEQIVEDFDVLKLADVYQIVGYYLAHKDALDAHIVRYFEEGESLRREMEKLYPPISKEERIRRYEERTGNKVTDEVLG
jgi:uncharacterized protein (DUF433 family)